MDCELTCWFDDVRTRFADTGVNPFDDLRPRDIQQVVQAFEVFTAPVLEAGLSRNAAHPLVAAGSSCPSRRQYRCAR